MAAFNYIALNKQGKRAKGVIEADSARQARQQLQRQGLTPIEIKTIGDHQKGKTKKSFLSRKSVRPADLALITRQMSVLLSAAIPIDEVLSSVAQQTEKDHIKSILLGVRARVLEGYTLAHGMDQFPRAFPKLFRTTVASGEKSGKLDSILIRLADYTEKQHHIRQKIQQAMIYPSMMTGVSICVIIFLLIYVVPKIIGVFHQTNQVLPLATVILVGISNFIKHYGIYLLVALIALAFGINRLLKREKNRYRFHQFLVKLPIFGKAFITLNGARFGRTLGILTASTVPVLDGMQSASELVTLLPMRRALEKAKAEVREGSPIHFALQRTRFFSPMFIHLIASGENSGQLEDMLIRAANQQEHDVEMLIETTLTLFEPVMILVMGGVVLFIVLAILLPIFDLDQFSG